MMDFLGIDKGYLPFDDRLESDDTHREIQNGSPECIKVGNARDCPYIPRKSRLRAINKFHFRIYSLPLSLLAALCTMDALLVCVFVCVVYLLNMRWIPPTIRIGWNTTADNAKYICFRLKNQSTLFSFCVSLAKVNAQHLLNSENTSCSHQNVRDSSKMISIIRAECISRCGVWKSWRRPGGLLADLGASAGNMRM